MDLEKKAKAIANIKSKQGSTDKFIYDSRKPEAASIAFRKNLIESQLRVNYVNEFDSAAVCATGRPCRPLHNFSRLRAQSHSLRPVAATETARRPRAQSLRSGRKAAGTRPLLRPATGT